MMIAGRRRWVLWRLGRALRRSDPHLVAMLTIFCRLTAGEAIISWEQEGSTAGRWMRRILAGLGCVLAGLAACGRRAIRRAGLACAAARRRFRGRVRAAGPPSGKR